MHLQGFWIFLGKIATVFITSTGNFKVIEVHQQSFQPPKTIDNAMKLERCTPTIYIQPTDVIVRREKTQRFTMRDIGRLKNRVENIDPITALSLLERDAESFEIQDANGLNRFRSGFVVDNFVDTEWVMFYTKTMKLR